MANRIVFSLVIIIWTLVAFHPNLDAGDKATLNSIRFEWVRNAGGSDNDGGRSIVVDDIGNCYVAGYFFETAIFGSWELQSHGGSDVFIAKYSRDGNCIWARGGGGKGDDEGYSIAMDENHNCFIAGTFSGSAAFDSVHLISHGGLDVFVAKYDSDGNIVWAQKAGGISEDECYSVTAGKDGSCFITGGIRGIARFGRIELRSQGDPNVFVARYDNNGNCLWAKNAGCDKGSWGNSIACDKDGSCYVSGVFLGPMNLDTVKLSSTHFASIFIAKYDKNGYCRWAKSAGGGGTEAHNYGNGVTVDDSCNVYATGSFCDTALFGVNKVYSSGSADVFIAKYNGDGVSVWAKNAYGVKDKFDLAFDIAVDAKGNIYTAGLLLGTAALGYFRLMPYGPDDIYIAKYDNNGNCIWASNTGSSESTLGGSVRDINIGIAADSNGFCYVTGFMNGSIDYTNGLSLTSYGGRDVLIGKLKP